MMSHIMSLINLAHCAEDAGGDGPASSRAARRRLLLFHLDVPLLVLTLYLFLILNAQVG